MPSAQRRSFCLGLNVLTLPGPDRDAGDNYKVFLKEFWQNAYSYLISRFRVSSMVMQLWFGHFELGPIRQDVTVVM